MLFSPTGLVADFVPVSQFWPGHTEDACSAFAAKLNQHAGFPGHGTKATAAQIEVEGLALYARFFGNADAANQSGPDVPAFEMMLSESSVAFRALPDDALSIEELSRALSFGYGVIATIYERNVLDRTVGGYPYGWDAGDKIHIITLAGHAGANYLAVDPANVTGQLQGSNRVRLWPRPYDAGSLQPFHAWIIAYPWMDPIPSGLPSTWADAEYQGDPTWTSKFQQQAAVAMWNATAHLFNDGQSPRFTSGIANEWQIHYRNGEFYGPPTCEEYEVNTWSGKPIKVQLFQSGWCEWPVDGSSSKWYRFM